MGRWETRLGNDGVEMGGGAFLIGSAAAPHEFPFCSTTKIRLPSTLVV